MAPEQDNHRNKRARTIEVTGSSSTLSATHLASHQNVQPRPLTVPRGPAINNPFVPQSHDSRGRVSPDWIDDFVDASSSRGNGVALPFRDRGIQVLPADINKTANEDSEMRDAAFVSADDEGGEVSRSESGYQHGEDDTIDRSSSKGKGRALSISEDSRPGALVGAEGRSDRVAQNTDMENSGNQYWNDEDREEEGDDGDGPIGRYDFFHQVYPAETVDPPVQEVLIGEDGTLEIRAEGVSGRGSGEN